MKPIWDDGFEGCWGWGREKVDRESQLLVGRQVNERWKVFRRAYATDDEGDIVRKKLKMDGLPCAHIEPVSVGTDEANSGFSQGIGDGEERRLIENRNYSLVDRSTSVGRSSEGRMPLMMKEI